MPSALNRRGPPPENDNQTTKSKNDMTIKTSNKPTYSLTPFAFEAVATQQVSLVGNFNGWDTKTTLMHKGTDGIWRVSVALKPGRYEYRFYADGVWRDDPKAQQKTANPMGTENCVRIVVTPPLR
jgi:1,4-alpha-glucan branching enzyme